MPDLRPIQVFLETRRFIEPDESKPFGGGSKDFFHKNDKGFAEHKIRIKSRLESISQSLRATRQPGGFVQVRQREGALAKTHRPLGHLFSEKNGFAFVGAEHVGELLFQTTSEALSKLVNTIEGKAEITPSIRTNPKTGKLEQSVSGYRSELGGIDDVRLHRAPDKVRFSALEAVTWMRQPNIIGGYVVELFRPRREVGLISSIQLISQLRQACDRIQGGVLIRSFLPSTQTSQFGEPPLAISIHLTSGSERYIELPFQADGIALEMAEASLPEAFRGVRSDLTLSRHDDLLAMLAEQTLVRSVELPPILETRPVFAGQNLGQVRLAEPNNSFDYPTVAIIDGGVACDHRLNQWKVGDAALVPPEDRDESHGTFIAGLVCASSTLNPALADYLEPGGCKFYDLDFFPRRDRRNDYYSDIEELFDTLDEKVKVAKREHNVRVFNLSFSIGARSSRLSYSLSADRLDRVARSNDVIFVVAAGNLDPSELRPPWPGNNQEAIAMLAAFGSGDQHITSPSEHILGLTVGAVNPCGVAGHVPFMPTTYTRRGPGAGGARKPDLAQMGGAGSIGTTLTGLVSLTPQGEAVHNCGTSFASPLVAATIATLDQRLGRQASRETLLALPIHRARRPQLLDRPEISHIVRDFVGFGIAPNADAMLNDDPHSITLVFSEALRSKEVLDFRFAWPRSLVNPDGSCRGEASLTMSYTPPIDPDHGEEAIRVQLEAHLQQEIIDEKSGQSSWVSHLSHDCGQLPQGVSRTESDLIRSGLKWSPTKRYQVCMKKGRGNTSNWKLSVNSLVRAGVSFPSTGVNFSLMLTISDLNAKEPVREEMRMHLQNLGLKLADITLAHQVRAGRY